MNKNISWDYDNRHHNTINTSADTFNQYNLLYDEHQTLITELMDTKDSLEKVTTEQESLMNFYQNLKKQLQLKLDENDEYTK